MQTFISTNLFICLYFVGPLSVPTHEMTISEKCNKASVTVIDDQIQIIEDIHLILSGKLATTGDCSPIVKLGLLKKNSDNTWDTIVNINHLGTLLCGFGMHEWQCDTVTTNLYHVDFYNYFKNTVSDTGTYCFTYISIKRSKANIHQTNEFKIIN